MTKAERQMVKELVDEKRRAQVEKARRRRRVDPFVYARVLAACCPESTVDVEAHARRVAFRVAQVRGVG